MIIELLKIKKNFKDMKLYSSVSFDDDAEPIYSISFDFSDRNGLLLSEDI